MKSKKTSRRRASPVSPRKSARARTSLYLAQNDLAALLCGLRKTSRTSTAARVPGNTSANETSSEPPDRKGGRRPLQLRVYPAPFFGHLPLSQVYLAPPAYGVAGRGPGRRLERNQVSEGVQTNHVSWREPTHRTNADRASESAGNERRKFAPYDPRHSRSWRRSKVAPQSSEPRSDITAATTTSSSDQTAIQSLAPDAQSIMPRKVTLAGRQDVMKDVRLCSDDIVRKMGIVFSVLLAMNALVALLLYLQHVDVFSTRQLFNIHGLKAIDTAASEIGPEPLVCMYQCTDSATESLQATPDDFCDLVYYQLEQRFTFLDWPNSSCIRQLVRISSGSSKEKYGITVFNSQGDKSLEQIMSSIGVTQFIKLWTFNVKHHGVTFASGTYPMLITLAHYNLKILDRLKALQVAVNTMTGESNRRRYVLLGVQGWFSNFSAEREPLSAALKKIVTKHPVNLLVVYTHLWHWYSSPCVVSGPTILRNALRVPLPAMDTTVELVNAAETPRYVTVLLSLSAIVSHFTMESGWSSKRKYYGGLCADREYLPYANVCSADSLANPNIVPEAHVAIQRLYKDDVITQATFETKETIKSKGADIIFGECIYELPVQVDYAYRYIRRKNFGWAIHYLVNSNVNDSCPLLGVDGEDIIAATVLETKKSWTKWRWLSLLGLTGR